MNYYNEFQSLTEEQQDSINQYIIDKTPEFISELGELGEFVNVLDIANHGCASGSYLPAVIYYDAYKHVFLNHYHEPMLNYIKQSGFELEDFNLNKGIKELACYICCLVVELFAQNLLIELENMIEQYVEDNNNNEE